MVYRNITFRLMRQAAQHPNATALILPQRDISYKTLNWLTWKCAQCLHDKGVRHTDVVLLSFGDLFLNAIVCLGLLRIGATIVPIPSAATKGQVQRIIEITNPRFCVSENAAGITQSVPTLVISYNDINRSSKVEKEILVERPSAYALYAIGSGSTGQQKVIPQSHQQLRTRCKIAFGESGLDKAARIFSATSLEYVAGINRLLSAIHHGAAFAFEDSNLTLPAYCKEKRITIVFSTVFHAESLLSDVSENESGVLAGLDSIRLSGSAVSDDLRARIGEKLCKNLQVSYGTNESGRLTLASAPDVYTGSGAVGKALPGVVIEIVDTQDKPLAANALGIIRVKTDSMVDGYLNDTVATNAAFRSGWFYPGDLGSLSSDGDLSVRGRSDDLMILNGINIFPAEIEQVLKAHPSVSDVVVFPYNHKVHQDIPICAYTLIAENKLSEEDFESYAKVQLGFKAPAGFVLLADMPRNGRGKIEKQKLIDSLRFNEMF